MIDSSAAALRVVRRIGERRRARTPAVAVEFTRRGESFGWGFMSFNARHFIAFAVRTNLARQRGCRVANFERRQRLTCGSRSEFDGLYAAECIFAASGLTWGREAEAMPPITILISILHQIEIFLLFSHAMLAKGSRATVRYRRKLSRMRPHTSVEAILLAAALATLWTLPAHAQQPLGNFGADLIVSSSTYTDPVFAANQSGVLPLSTPTATAASSAFCTTTNCSGNVWNNDGVDANFGVTSQIFLSDINTTTGHVDNTVNVTSLAAQQGINLVTSFSSKSELALNLTPTGNALTFMAYNSTPAVLDVSNANTPGIIEPGNTDTQTPTYRAVGQLSLSNNALSVTTTNAYDGNNGRAAILGSNGYYYMVGNAGNGNGSPATTAATGVQLLTPGVNATASTPGTTQVGSYSITQNGDAADKTAKDNNFRGETVFDGELYVSKGSGSNGIDTVYAVGPSGMTSSTTSPTATGTPQMSILPGFSTTLAKATPTVADPVYHPFGLFFANATTLYVADEGSGSTSDLSTTPYEAGGLQKWSLVNGSWQLDYTLRGSLIGSSYTVSGAGGLAGDSLTTSVDGLRNLSGQVNANGSVTLYAVTSTIGSNLGDAGADPNQIVAITDTLADTSAAQAAAENFTVLDTAALGQVYRGVALAPVPLPAAAWLLLSGLGGLGAAVRRRCLAA
jgi:hypothetical protein